MTPTTMPLTEQTGQTQLVSSEPWPSKGIQHYKSIADGDWGFLHVFEDGHFEFDSESVPNREEILQRWSAYLTEEIG